ncbi:MAG: hypothetical protein ACODAJ_12545 [Planctomycetota bacterium]
MTRSGFIRLVLCVAALCVVATVADGGERKKKERGPRKARARGEVRVTKDEDSGDVTAVALVRGQKEVACDLEEGNAKQMAAELEGKKAVAMGTWKKLEGQRVLVVEEYKEWTRRARKPKKPKGEEPDM